MTVTASQYKKITAESIYQSLMHNAADGIVLSDLEGKIIACNVALTKLCGFTENQLLGRPLDLLVKFDEDEPELSSEIDAEIGREPEQIDHFTDLNTVGADKVTIAGPPDGSQTESQQALSPLLPDLATIRLRSGSQLKMPASHFALPDEKKEIQGYVTLVYIVQVNSVQQAQTEFVSTVSHELRTPLTSIKGFADTILRAGDRLDTAQQRRYLGIIKDQADRLTRLVEDLLAVSRLESKRMQLTIRAVDLGQAIQRVLRNLADKAGDHRVLVTLPAGCPPVWADADRIEQILTNLIDNAIKYSPAKTSITITARGIDSNPEMVEFSVTDEGVGIPEQHISKIFTKFGRLDNPLVRQTEGTGLGLYITRSLVIALGGQIKVESSPGRTTFTVQLLAAGLEEQAARGRG
jgi:two-component system phosphate regulon sensor histidine kinase PhoR